MQAMEQLVTSGKIMHGGNPVLRWMAGNVQAKLDPAGNIMPDKSKTIGRIDGIVAGIMALGRSLVKEEPDVFSPNIA
jgi:phage terminase large subunit-like protein